MDITALEEFGRRYTAAWCSQQPHRVAAFFAENGTLTINDGAPSAGRAAITTTAQGFMTAFPDMVVTMDGVTIDGQRAVYRWTLTGTNTGPGGTGKAVRISGYEEWTLGADVLIAESKGHFDQADYHRQLGTDASQ
ncbi:MAG TPA: nuclear transport factor 2 family protein [Vicinamibacterales bacterium]|nr:nuclear transport factor 2 family protein [Vicinamibacterales bacterium]